MVVVVAIARDGAALIHNFSHHVVVGTTMVVVVTIARDAAALIHNITHHIVVVAVADWVARPSISTINPAVFRVRVAWPLTDDLLLVVVASTVCHCYYMCCTLVLCSGLFFFAW